MLHIYWVADVTDLLVNQVLKFGKFSPAFGKVLLIEVKPEMSTEDDEDGLDVDFLHSKNYKFYVKSLDRKIHKMQLLY